MPDEVIGTSVLKDGQLWIVTAAESTTRIAIDKIPVSESSSPGWKIKRLSATELEVSPSVRVSIEFPDKEGKSVTKELFHNSGLWRTAFVECAPGDDPNAKAEEINKEAIAKWRAAHPKKNYLSEMYDSFEGEVIFVT